MIYDFLYGIYIYKSIVQMFIHCHGLSGLNAIIFMNNFYEPNFSRTMKHPLWRTLYTLSIIHIKDYSISTALQKFYFLLTESIFTGPNKPEGDNGDFAL